MQRGRRLAALALVAAPWLVAACGGGDEDKADDKPATSVAVAETAAAPSTGESIIGSTIPTTTTTAPAPTTTLLIGLPTDLGIPPAGGFFLGPSSTLSNSITVRGVPLVDVVTFVREQLASLGWTVNPDLTFFGPGAVGQATVAQVGDVVEIQLGLSGPPQ